MSWGGIRLSEFRVQGLGFRPLPPRFQSSAAHNPLTLLNRLQITRAECDACTQRPARMRAAMVALYATTLLASGEYSGAKASNKAFWL